MSERPEARLALALAIILVAPLGVLRDAIGAASSVELSADVRLIAELGLRVDAHPVRERSGWRPPRTILVAAQLHDQLPALKAAAPTVKFIEMSRQHARARSGRRGCRARRVLGRRARQGEEPAVDPVARAPGSRAACSSRLLRERHLLLTNMQRTAGPSMAEHVLAMMLVLSRHLD